MKKDKWLTSSAVWLKWPWASSSWSAAVAECPVQWNTSGIMVEQLGPWTLVGLMKSESGWQPWINCPIAERECPPKEVWLNSPGLVISPELQLVCWRKKCGWNGPGLVNSPVTRRKCGWNGPGFVQWQQTTLSSHWPSLDKVVTLCTTHCSRAVWEPIKATE